MNNGRAAHLIGSTLLCLVIYTFTAHLLSVAPIFANSLGISLGVPALVDLQRQIYKAAPMRSMIQGDAACVAGDTELGYRPREGTCEFSNYEFNTKLAFLSDGSASLPTIESPRKRIAVLGDSHAMGWGVSSDQTFSSLLTRYNFSVYSFSMASFATEQEMLALLLHSDPSNFDYVIIQYCENDIGKNQREFSEYKEQEFNAYKKRRPVSFTASDKVGNASRFYLENYSFLRLMSLPFRAVSSFFDPRDSFTREETQLHQTKALRIINKYRDLIEAPIVVFYSNPHGKIFEGWEDFSTEGDVIFLDLNLSQSYYYDIDDHLNASGHLRIARALRSFILKAESGSQHDL